MKDGWIKLYRSLEEHWLNENPEYLGWWVQLLLMASWEDKQVSHDSHLFILQRGQCIVSVPALMKKWGKSKPTIINFLKRLESDGMIRREVMFRHTPILTICNYGRYQGKNELGGKKENGLYPLNTQSLYPQVYPQKEDINSCKSNELGGKNENGFDGILDPIVYPIVYPNKEIKKYNNNNNNTQDARVCAHEEIFDKKIFLENCAISLGVSIETIEDFAKEFVAEQKTLGKEHKNDKDAQSHFFYWAKIKIEKQKQNKITKKNGNFNNRRGIDAGNHSIDEYEKGF